MTSKTLPEHGTLSRYRFHQCRCEACTEVNASYLRHRRQAINAGTWEPYVEAEPVRQHILRLHAAGFSNNRIANLAGFSSIWTVQNFLTARGRRGRKYRSSPEIAAKILAVQPDEATPGMVDCTGTRRRTQALIAAGWPLASIARAAGHHTSNMASIMRRPLIRRSTAADFTAAYDALTHRTPARSGVTKQAIARSRNRAAAHKWPPPRYWAQRPDAIDDPHFIAEYGRTKADLLAEEATFLVTVAGLSRTQAAARLGKDRSYVDRVLGPTDLRKAA